MPKKPKPAAKPGKPTPSTSISYARKPHKIGPYLESRVKELGLDEYDIARWTGCTKRNAYKIYKRDHLKIPEMMSLSEMIQENLFLLYHPNIPPLPNPLQAELDKYKAYAEESKEREKLHELTLIENKSLRDQVEQLKEVIVQIKNGK